MRFELTRGNPNGLAVHRLNHSATASNADIQDALLLQHQQSHMHTCKNLPIPIVICLV